MCRQGVGNQIGLLRVKALPRDNPMGESEKEYQCSQRSDINDGFRSIMMESKLSKERSEDMSGDGNRTRTEANGLVISKWPKCVGMEVLEYLSRDYVR